MKPFHRGLRGSLIPTFLVPLALGLAAPLVASPMGEEELGNKPVSAQPGWAGGVVDAVNLESRVYRVWVNGNESFFFRGKTADLNRALAKFAAIRSEGLEIVLLPSRGGTRTFDGSAVDCDWELKVPSGIYLSMGRREKGTRVFTTRPTLTVSLGSRRLELETIEIPPGATVLGEEDLVARYLEGLQSDDPHVAGHAAYLLGAHGDALESIDPIVKCLASDESYVRRCAASCLGRLGKRAAPAIPRLEVCLNREDNENARTSYRDAIGAIEAACEADTGTEAGRDRGRLRAAIRAWLARRSAPARPSGSSGGSGTPPGTSPVSRP